MKVLMEIEGDVVKYEYSAGVSKHCGEQPLTLEGLKIFNELVQHLSLKINSDKKDRHRALESMAYCSAFPEEVAQIKKEWAKK